MEQIKSVAKAVAAFAAPFVVAAVANWVDLDPGAVELIVTSLVTAGLVWLVPNRQS